MFPALRTAERSQSPDAFAASRFGKLAAERTIVNSPQPWSSSKGLLRAPSTFAPPTAQHAPKLYDDGQGSPKGLYFPKGDVGTHMVCPPRRG